MITLEDKTTLLEAAKQFGETLKASSEYERFLEAQKVFNADADVQRMVEQYNQMVQKLQLLQQLQEKDDELMARYRELNHQIETHPLIHELMNAQKAWKALTEEANAALTQKLGYDFADMAKPEGGCC
ncbi:MAG: YlbF family regulator [Candidatus Cyclonatronum sp.]|uniref:YlbF family regulator n=1 Tax=Cyclonatronum sp. TaxID=3024185 RepID=UPI0025BEE058|nr:YlbF family regulator [Cyclonatronum sp.]MCC5934528.1 YlbF family regulator [Balneolales bacterium]MCH8486557.1 YlbF family regulator [Cyclonatronum sp.]